MLGNFLERTRQVHLTLRKLCFGLARRSPKQSLEFPIRHSQSGAVIEVFHIETKCSILLYINQVIINGIDKAGFSVWSKAHDLILTRVHFEAKIIGKG